MIIDIRGTHGSGKSWVVRQILADESQPILDQGKIVGYSAPSYDCAVVGRYNCASGGCDRSGSADNVVSLARLFSSKYSHVLMEGIQVAHTFQRYHELALELGDYTFCFLDTPLKQCIRRVKERRLDRGNTKPLDPKNVVSDWHNIWERVRGKCLAAGHKVVVLPYRDPLPVILRLLGETR